MRVTPFWLILVLGCGAASGAVAQSMSDRGDFMDEVRALRAGLGAKDAPAPPPGGLDPDSFGRNVKYDGLLVSGVVTLRPDCTPEPGEPPPGPDDRCLVPNPAPSPTSYDFADIGRLTLPGRSAESLLCHWLTPVVFYTFQNPTAVQAGAIYRLRPYVVIESDVLDDPTLIDPTTGLPFDGKLEASFSATYIDQQSLDPGQDLAQRFSHTRVCITGFLSRQILMATYGLTDAQARRFFRRDMTLRFGLRGDARLVTVASVIYGLRVVGD